MFWIQIQIYFQKIWIIYLSLIHIYYNHFFELTIQEGNDILLETNEFRLNPNQSKTVKLKLQPHEEALDNTQQGKTFDF